LTVETWTGKGPGARWCFTGDTKTRLQLRLRVWGSSLDPAALTQAIGVQPARSFQVGEGKGAAARNTAGWEWFSRWGDADAEPLVDEMLNALGPGEEALRAAADAGASVKLTVVGDVRGDLVQTQGDAEAIGWHGGEDENFRPFIAADRPVIYLDLPALRFLTAVLATVDTHVDFDLDDPGDGWE
jgi:hypothetical protein